MTVLEVAAGIMDLRIDGITEIGFALLRQTTRQLVNETTSGAVSGIMELRSHGIAENWFKV